jgi:ferrous iron transport protein A
MDPFATHLAYSGAAISQVVESQVTPMRKPRSLGHAHRGFVGRIRAIHAQHADSILPPAELESRLIEMGFVEGASVEILHEGAFGRDPIAVRVDNATVAIRRREAMAILVG